MPWRDLVCVGKPIQRRQTLRGNVTTWLGGALRIGELDVNGLEEVVQAVEALPDGTILKGLFLLDHGNPSNVWVGDEDIGRETLATPNYAALLRRMRPRFSPDDGFIHVMNCEAGRHESMLRTLANEVGVRCYGGTGYQHLFGINTGPYRVAYPHGAVTTTARPRVWGAGG